MNPISIVQQPLQIANVYGVVTTCQALFQRFTGRNTPNSHDSSIKGILLICPFYRLGNRGTDNPSQFSINR